MTKSEDETVPTLKLVTEVPIEELDPKSRLGTMIRRARRKRGLSLRDLGAATSMDLVMLGEIERGRRPATQAHIEAIAEAMEMHPQPLMEAAQLWHREHWRGGPEVTLEPNGMKVATRVPDAYRVAQLEDELDRCVVDLTLARDGYLAVAQAFEKDERHGGVAVVAQDHVNRISSAAKRAYAIRHESWGQTVAPEEDKSGG